MLLNASLSFSFFVFCSIIIIIFAFFSLCKRGPCSGGGRPLPGALPRRSRGAPRALLVAHWAASVVLSELILAKEAYRDASCCQKRC